MEEFRKFWGYDEHGLRVKSDAQAVKDPNFILKAKTKSELDFFKSKDTQLTLLILSVVEAKKDFLSTIINHPKLKLNMRD